MPNRKVVIAITGASGSIYARELLNQISAMDQRPAVGVVMSENARTVWETELEDKSYESIPFRIWDPKNFRAPFASGSAGYDTMIIIPCSMGTLGRIAGGVSSDLISRAADVMLKERRRLILVLRDTPYNLIHIRNMERVTLAGGIICPATPSFYSKPEDIPTLVRTVTDRVLQLAGFEPDTFHWGEED